MKGKGTGLEWPASGESAAVALARELAKTFALRADEADREGRLAPEDVQRLKSSGYLGLSIPREYGGQELSLKETAAAQLELAQGSAAVAILAAMHLQVFGHAAENRPWPEAVFARLCRAGTNGTLFNFVASEPQLGSPSRGGLPQTTAVPQPGGEGWIVNGHKTWSTGGRHLTHMLVRVRIEDEPGVILVLQDTPGVEWVDTWSDSLSLRASESNDVYFRNVVVPADHLIERGAGREPAPPNAWFPTLLAAVYLGTAVAARNALIQYALERVPTALGRPIATLPTIQRQIGEIDLTLQAALALLFDAAERWDRDREDTRRFARVVAAKVYAVKAAAEVTEKALQVAGGLSLTGALPLERYFRDVRAGFMQPPSGDAALELIGRSAIESRR